MRAALVLAAAIASGSGCAGPSVKAGEGGAGSSPSAAPSVASRQQATAAPSSSAATSPSAPEVLPALDGAGPGWQAGHRYGYRFTLGSSVSFAAQAATDYELSGELRLTCISREADETTLRVELESPRVTSKSAAEQAELERGLPGLEAPFFATFRRGVVSEMRIARGMTPAAVGTYRTLVAALQLARPVGSKQSWQARERDTTGEYLAEYRRAPGGLVHKRKLRYLSLLVPSADREKLPTTFLPEVVSSRAELRATGEGQPLVVELQEQLALRQLEVAMAATNRVTLRWLSDAPGASLEESQRQLAETQPLGVAEAYVATPDPAAVDAARIAGSSFASIVAALTALPREEPRPEAADEEQQDQPPAGQDDEEQKARQQRGRELQRLIVALAATFRQQPETIASAMAQIKAGASIRGELLDGLAASGSEASQAALSQLLDSPGVDADLRHAAAFALSRTPKPSQLAIRALIAQLDDEHAGTQALYGLGTYCRILREAGDAAASDELGRLLLQRLSAADGELAVTRSLRAISNSGYSPALGAVKPLLDDPRDAVRADALEAVRLMDSPEVDRLLAGRLAADGSAKSQVAALDALSVRKPTPALVAALSSTIRHADPHVRYRAVEVATSWLERRPELRSVLARVARQDGEEKIRNLAASALRPR